MPLSASGLRAGAVKEQYVGDINDYRKFALLRRLRGDNKTAIGVVWMLTPPDGRRDGQRIQYLKQPDTWRQYDPELFDKLASIAEHPGPQRLQLVEKSGLIPSTD